MIGCGDTVQNKENGHVGIVAEDKGAWWEVFLLNLDTTVHKHFPKGQTVKLVTEDQQAAEVQADAIIEEARQDPTPEEAATWGDGEKAANALGLPASQIEKITHIEKEDPFEAFKRAAGETFDLTPA